MADDVRTDDQLPGEAEATAMFARARARISPHDFRNEAYEAANALIRGVERVARAAGYEATGHYGQVMISLSSRGAALVTMDSTVTPAKIHVGVYGVSDPPEEAKVEYDPANGCYVGTEADHSRHPVPGAMKVVLRPAVEVVAEMAAAKIEERIKARAAGR